MGNILSASTASAASVVHSYSANWLVSLARASVVAFLERAIQTGYLEIQDGSDTLTFGQPAKDRNAVYLHVLRPTFWQRVFVSGDLGFSEAYMVGDVHVEAENLEGVFHLWLDNEARMTGLSTPLARASAVASGLWNAFLGQTLSRARLNVIAAYDQSNDLFSAFLSCEMMYSCALWASPEGGVRGDIEEPSSLPPSPALTAPPSPTRLYSLASASSSTDTLFDTFSPRFPVTLSVPTLAAINTAPRLRLPHKNGIRTGELEAAQRRKIQHVVSKLHLQPGHRLLEFGSGWGGLAIEAARTSGCFVDTLTLSVEQKKLAEERVRDAGLEERITVHLMDYRDMPARWEKRFDAFVSIEMLEHVGSQHYQTYFGLVDWALKAENAHAVVSCSTFPESRYTGYQPEDFMRRYMWPNSCLPSATTLITAAQSASASRLTLEGVENHGSHYPRTLREWGRRLEANLRPEDLGLQAEGDSTCSDDPAAAPDSADARLTLHLPAHSPQSLHADFEAIKRKWQYLFAYAAAGFSKGYITCHMITFSKNSQPIPCA